MRLIIRTLLCAAALTLAGFAAAAEPKNGADYQTLPERQNTDAGDKVEVTEFFAYYCPHCNRFEPLISAWASKQGANIVFRRVHVGGAGGIGPQQRLFYTLEALGLLDPYHQKAFDAMHIERLRLATDDAVFDWAAKSGIDRARFIEAWNSFGVQAKQRRANTLMGAYRIDQWPMVAIDGRYMTSPAMAGDADKTARTEEEQQQAALRVMDYLVAKAKAEKK
jgi:thiol:disulfide interchange protein DsbA